MAADVPLASPLPRPSHLQLPGTKGDGEVWAPSAQAREGDKDGEMNGPIGVPEKAENK